MDISKIKELLKSSQNRLEELVKRSEASKDVEELRSINKDISSVKNDINSFNSLIKEFEEEEARAKNPLPLKEGKKENTMNYKTAFKDFVQKGTPIPAELISNEMRSALNSFREQRAAGTTPLADITALVPTTVMDEVVRTAKTGVYGQLFDRVRKTNIRGGVRYPLSNLVATFNWVTEGVCPVGEKAGTANTFIEFGSYIGLAQINTSIVASIEAEPVFYAELTRLIAEAFLKAIDNAIVNGTGVGQPLGITKDERVTNVVTLTEDEVTKWKAWEKIVQAIPLSKRGGHIVLPIGTIDKYLRTLTDDNNRPLFFDSSLTLGNVQANGVEGRFDGQNVLAVENDILKNFDEANAGDVIGFYAPLYDYAINSNLQFAISQFRDELCLQDITRGMIICDGKPLDTTGMILIKKA